MKKISLQHLNYLTDDFGIWQHTKGRKIDKRHGYALDDAARALLVALSYRDVDKAKIYLDFLTQAISPEKIVNFFSSSKKALNRPWSDDALGEAYWALAECYRNGLFLDEVITLLRLIAPSAEKSVNLKSQSYYLLGAKIIDTELSFSLANKIKKKYLNNYAEGWYWPEDNLNYGNAIVPLSLIEASLRLPEFNYLEIGLKMLDFLNKETKQNFIPITIGNRGWFSKGKEKAIFDQQPIDIAYQVLANIGAWQILKNEHYLAEAKRYFSWFWGNNLLGKPLIDLKDESCRDGLGKNNIDENRGAENIACFLLAQAAIWPYLK